MAEDGASGAGETLSGVPEIGKAEERVGRSFRTTASAVEATSFVVSSDEGDSDVVFTAGDDDDALDGESKKRKKDKRRKKKEARNNSDCREIDDVELLASGTELVCSNDKNETLQKEERRKKKKSKKDKDLPSKPNANVFATEDVILVDDAAEKSERSEKRRRRKEQKLISELDNIVALDHVEGRGSDVNDKYRTKADSESTGKRQKLKTDAQDASFLCKTNIKAINKDETPMEVRSLNGKKRGHSENTEIENLELIGKKKRKKERKSEMREIDSADDELRMEKEEKRMKNKKKDLDREENVRDDCGDRTEEVVSGETVVEKKKKKKSKSKKSRSEQCPSSEVISD